MGNSIEVSFVCPVFNEKDHIDNILSFFDKQDQSRCELLLVDGGSTDGTIKIINKRVAENSNVRLIDNPFQYQNFALNIGISEAIGKLIIRLDAHTSYEDDYATEIDSTISKTEADIVGGPMRPVGISKLQKAIAYATTVKFGVGDSSFHDIDHEGEVDTVYLGAYKRELTEEIGYYDEDLICNEDDEFAYRARAMGKRIYLNPAIRSSYQPRSTLTSLFRQYFRYGFYKPLVFIKTSEGMQVRHWVPAAFSIYLLSLPLAFEARIWIIPLILYFLLDLYYSFSNAEGLGEKVLSLMVFPCLHLAYGLGFISGCFKWFFRKN